MLFLPKRNVIVQDMTKQTKNKIEYLVVFIREFAKRFSLSESQAFRYMKNFGGIQLVLKNYGIMHTLDIDDTISDTALYCRKTGGKL